MDPETRQFEMAAKTALPAVTGNCLPSQETACLK